MPQAIGVSSDAKQRVLFALQISETACIIGSGPQQVTNTMPGGYWSGVDLPSNVPPRPGVGLYFISKFLGQEIMRVFNQPDVKEKYSTAGIESVGNSPEQFGAFIKSDTARWNKVIKDSGIKLE